MVCDCGTSLTFFAAGNISLRSKITLLQYIISIHITKTRLPTILEILPPKNEKFQIKISDIFHISAQNIDCGFSLEPPRRGGSNEYPQSMF